MRWRAGGWLLAAGMAVAPAAFPQVMGGGLGRGAGIPGAMGGQNGSDGFAFYGVAAYGEYTSTAVPFGASLAPAGLDLGANYLAGAMASAGWQHTGPRTNAHISYTLSYDASIRYSQWSSLNHYLNFGIAHEVTPRLTFSFTGSAATLRWDQFFFEPTLLSEIADAPATYDELVSAILSGKYTNSELASILTGAPVLDSPAATLLYGTRFLTAAVQSRASYELSARLRFTAGVGGERTQHLNSGVPQDQEGAYLVPAVTTALAMAGLSYDLSPVTTIGLEGQAYRTFSHFEDTYSANALVTLGRAFGSHWIVQGRGGAGTYIPVRQTFAYKPGVHYVAGGSLTYKGYSETCMVNYIHTISDTSGLGAESADMAAVTWQWHRPGWRWGVFGGGRYQMLSGSALATLHAWVGNAGISRTLGAHTIMEAGAFYGRNSGLLDNTVANNQLLGVSLMISWTPRVIGM